MDKNAWFAYAAPLCRPFLEKRDPGCKLRATFGSLLNKTYVGRAAFQNMYDLVSSGSCWNVDEQERDWETRVRYELLESQVASTHARANTRWFVETDAECVQVDCFAITEDPSTTRDLVLKSSSDKLEIDGVTIRRIQEDTSLLTLEAHSPYAGVTIVKKKVFTVQTHFHWEYTFCLVWSSPFQEDRDDSAGALIFKQEPKCEVHVTCQLLAEPGNTATSWEYLAESLLYKIHDAVPSRYRSPGGASVSIPSVD